ncbi:SusC/RagA family TonB-linked outer membrane protein [Lacinutrix venerupis]|uniref:SusC/RagA family TonB-linked outer membrane protein n=1 Tax=Lacinutrix venerupis TaxID=1486034 RepID=UPI0012EC42EA|nr:TonB-dependent receptor [Lacinutrix venerupis]
MNLKLRQSKIKTLFSFLLLFSSFTVMAQTIVTGKVFSAEDNMPLVGASVIEKGTNNGVSVDFDGNFTLQLQNDEAQLEVSYLGFKTKEVTTTGGEITILLEEDANSLDEVVVVGYGTQRKSDLVNAVATTDLEKATLSPTSDVNEMLRGRIAGLQVNVGGGTLRPGGTSDIIFRGQGSIEGNLSAIYVVDGIIRDGGIEDIDQDDIKSIEFLKDASAQAIYGSRGANGVVLITTKRGKNKKMQVSYHGFLTSKTLEKNFDVYSGQEFAQLKREAVRATNADDSYSDDEVVFSEIELESIANNDFVDWEEELVKSGIVNSQAISISGGTENTKVFGSINYFKEEGIIPTSNYTRKTLRLNVDQKISDKVSVNFDLNLLNDDTERAANVNVITFSPLGRAYDEFGNLTQFPSGEELSAVNPLWNLREQNNEEKGNDFVINVTPQWQITDNLKYQLKTNFTRRTSERGQYQSSLSSAGDDDRGIARIDNNLREAYLVENILTYNKRINQNNKFDVTLVQSVQEDELTRTLTEGKGYAFDDLGYNGISDAIGSVNVFRENNTIRYVGFLARARYNLMDKYLFEFAARRDGASLNSEDNKWSNNFGGSLAWKLNNESFLKNVESIRELKLRASYGSLVNDLGLAGKSLFTVDAQPYVFDGDTGAGYSPSQVLPNNNLKFETITTLNLGLDFAVFNNILTGNFNYYDQRTKDLLLRRGVPPVTGYSFTYFNAGELQNTGVELALTANIINKEDLKWSVSTNWSNNKNKLLKLYNDGDGTPLTEDTTYGYYEGHPVGVIRQYQFQGIWQEGEDFANSPQANEESSFPQPDLRAGDIKVADINGDGKITEDDRVFTDPNPDWFGSFSTNLEYKGFDLFVDFYVVEGATKVNPFLSDFNNGGTLQGKVNGVKVDYYTPENPSNSYPRPNFDATPLYLNALAVKDASYVRLRTVSLGYTLNEVATSQIGLDQVRFYVTGTNLFTDTDYIGYSPEVNIRSTFSNADTGYPDATSFTFGVRLKF